MMVQDARPEHIPGIYRVRLAVRENVMPLEIVQRDGWTPERVADAFSPGRRGWVVEHDGEVVGFSIADANTRSIWALFVLEKHEGRGFGRALLTAAVDWLWSEGSERIWLDTDPRSRAEGFYRHLGWQATGTTAKGEIRFELVRPVETGAAQATAGDTLRA
jgi:GNAT superfamily N-acetyltransferase